MSSGVRTSGQDISEFRYNGAPVSQLNYAGQVLWPASTPATYSLFGDYVPPVGSHGYSYIPDMILGTAFYKWGSETADWRVKSGRILIPDDWAVGTSVTISAWKVSTTSYNPDEVVIGATPDRTVTVTTDQTGPYWLEGVFDTPLALADVATEAVWIGYNAGGNYVMIASNSGTDSRNAFASRQGVHLARAVAPHRATWWSPANNSSDVQWDSLYGIDIIVEGAADTFTLGALGEAIINNAPFIYYPLRGEANLGIDIAPVRLYGMSTTNTTRNFGGINYTANYAEFNPSDGCLNISAPGLWNYCSDITVEFMLYQLGSTQNGDNGYILSSYNSDNSIKPLSFYWRDDGVMMIEAADGTGATVSATYTGAATSGTHLISLTLTGGNFKVYIDGVLQTNDATSTTLAFPAGSFGEVINIYFGAGDGNESRSQGSDFACWGRALSASEILAHAQAAGVAT